MTVQQLSSKCQVLILLICFFSRLSAQEISSKIDNLVVERYSDKVSVSVSWQTLTELTAKEFVLERSYNGRWWEEVQRMPVAITQGGKPAPYRILDRAYRGQAHIIYYRIKIVEGNGYFVCSNVFCFLNRGLIESVVIPSQWTNEPALHFLLLGMANQSIKIQVLNLQMEPIRTYQMTVPDVQIYNWKESQVAIYQSQYIIRIILEQEKKVYYVRWCPLPLFL